MIIDANKRPTPPKMTDVLAELKEDIIKTINCVKVCTIESYDPATQRATVVVNIKQVVGQNPDVLVDFPLLVDVPAYVPGGGGAHISHPITKGDTGIVVFNDRDIEKYLETGGPKKPNTFRKHDLNDGLVIVGFRHNQNALTGISNEQVEVYWNASVNMQWKSGEIVATSPLFVHNGNTETNGDTEHNGNVETNGDTVMNGNLFISGNMQGTGGGSVSISSDLVQTSGKSISAGNGATGTFTTVTVQDGIVVSGS